MKKIVITGANSYIGTAVENWLSQYEEHYTVETVDMIDGTWREKDFSKYDVVYHVAGIAHADVGKVSEETKAFYYKINTDLAVETAKKAKSEGVKQFIFMSSMIIYGESGGLGHAKRICKDTVPSPANFYGDSKWQADQKIQQLANESFKVVIVRPPMIYGKDSKGNYPTLAKMAKKLPIFPKVQNQRSMLHIDNLCEFIRLMIENEETGVFFPQNKEYSQTSQLVQMIAASTGHHIMLTKLLNPFVWIASCIPGKVSGLVNKAFGNLTYDKEMSVYPKGTYQIVSLEESIEKTEH
ncbi:MAG: NAD-dependent epimerase/dehydratase family protein [Tyzzerella sp.]|nr:NAD-dependent epimerase/dehydratase family protein [Tyzzerella sp.]